MIHNASTSVHGNQHDMGEAARMLQEVAESIINAYELRTKQPREQLQKWMDEETFFSAHRAVQHGFADEVMYSSSRTQNRVVAACVDANGLLAQTVIDEYFAKKNEQPPQVNKTKRKQFLL